MTRPLTRREIADLEWRMDRELSITVACPQCKARVDEPCWNTELGTDLRAPAHWQRLKQSERGGEPVTATAEEWDTHWWQIWNDAMREAPAASDLLETEAAAKEIADRETAEQFGPRPEESA